MTTDTHQSLLNQCQDPQWAVARIEGLEGEIAGLKKDWLNDRKELNQSGKAAKTCAEELTAALHPQEPTS